MRIKQEDIQIINATEDHIDDWTLVFLKGMNSHRWMSRYLKEQNITKIDVSLSIKEDIEKKSQGEQFLIAYVNNNPVGIIRLEEYWLSDAVKVLSHFPLVLPKYQRKGIGAALVKEGITIARKNNYNEVWSECWSKDNREIQLYQRFFEKIGFKLKSNRFEMQCLLEDFILENNYELPILDITNVDELTDEFVSTLSKSYADSNDNLHLIENLGDKKTCREFLVKTKDAFEKMGFRIEFQTVESQGTICAALMTALSKQKAMVLEIGIIPEFRQRRIARKLLTDFLTKMKNKNIQEIILGVDAENIPAISLYEKLNFRKIWLGAMFLLENEKRLND